MQYYSIWQDAIYTVTGVSQTEYLIYDENNALIYAGRAVARPNQGSCEINISRIVQNYLNSKLPANAFNGTDFNTGQAIEPDAVKGFTLTDGKGNEFESYKFLNCWDYVTHFAIMYNAGLNYPLSKPANNHRAEGMYTFLSVFEKTSKKVRTTIAQATGNTCGYGALYYSNAMGGWDSFLIEGTVTKKDTYQRYNIENKWKADTLEEGSRTLVNTIDESWALNTHLMTDEEAKVISTHLFGSNNVFYHNFADNTITPVVITDTSVTYKTWRNQKRKRFYYTINIKSAQPKQRI